jgi:hypothetical protein
MSGISVIYPTGLDKLINICLRKITIFGPYCAVKFNRAVSASNNRKISNNMVKNIRCLN